MPPRHAPLSAAHRQSRADAGRAEINRPGAVIDDVARVDDVVSTLPAAISTLDRVEPFGLLDALVENGDITRAQRDAALATQQRTGSRVGRILLSSGIIDDAQLYAALATTWDLPYVEVIEIGDAVDDLRNCAPFQQLARERWLPTGRTPDGRVEIVTAERMTAERTAHIEAIIGAPVSARVASHIQISRAVQEIYRAEVVHLATEALWVSDPSASARTVLDKRQTVLGAIALLLFIACAILWPVATLGAVSAAVSLFFMLGIAFKFLMSMAGARKEFEATVTPEEVAALTDDELPVFTVLVPCYREAGIVGQLVDNLGSLDYPPDKLEILLLLEADDDETLAAARASDPPGTVTIVIAPDGQPRTKPRACNVGLALATGEFLVIYDAEDRPESDQLKKVVAGFRKSPETMVCLQAALNYFNAGENFLTRMFTLEYSFWFDYMLSGLDHYRLPIPLGGTSNHFRTEALRELGGWDPYNVTEDADLGIRASARGYRVGVIDSTTYEEANNAYGNWIRQRSRWIKGYMQTTLVHARHPVRLAQRSGLRAGLGFSLLIGGTAISFLAVIPLYLLFLVSLALPTTAIAPYFPGWVLWFSLTNLLLGNGLMIWVSMMGAFRRKRYWLVLWALLNPLYWLMHSVSAYKGLWQLITRPHYWEKTSHGLTDVDLSRAEDPFGAPA